MPLSDLLHVFAPLVTSCRGFHAAWDAAAPPPGGDDPLSGRWQGEWVSEANDARGPLRCVVTRIDRTRWRACFHATFVRVLKACYDTTFELHGTDFKGTSDLGRLGGGVYEYAGSVSGDDFVSTFRSRTDRGTFRMRRVGREAG